MKNDDIKNMNFSDNLRKVIADRRLKLSAISKATGIPTSTLSEWTAGRVPKVSSSLFKLCSYLKISLDEMVMPGKNSGAQMKDYTSVILELGEEKFKLILERLK